MSFELVRLLACQTVDVSWQPHGKRGIMRMVLSGFLSTQFPVVCFIGLRPHGVSPEQFSMSVSILVQLMYRQSCWSL